MMKQEGIQNQFLIQQPSNQQINSFEKGLYGAGSEIIKSELGAYGESLIEFGSAFVQSNISKYFSNPQYYFQVNEDYVQNKLKVILLPFLHKGHWMRTTERVRGEYQYKPPIYDINAPDLYIPLMAFGTYVLLSGFFLGINNKFSPEVLGVQLTNGLLVWLLQVLLLESTLHSLGDGDIPVLDIVAYGGYIFASASIAMIARIIWSHSFYVVAMWESLCIGAFLVKTMKRILVAEVRSCQKNSSKCHYLLLFIACAQIPSLFWLCNVGV